MSDESGGDRNMCHGEEGKIMDTYFRFSIISYGIREEEIEIVITERKKGHYVRVCFAVETGVQLRHALHLARC